MLCSNTRRCPHHQKAQRSNSHKLGRLKNSWRAGSLQKGQPRPGAGSLQKACVLPLHQSGGLNPGVFFLSSSSSAAEPSRAHMSDMKQNHRNGPRAESASLSGPYTCSSTRIRTTSQGQRGMRDVMSGKEKGGGGVPSTSGS